MLKPVKEQHSIARVQATIFFAQAYPRPDYLFELLSSDAKEYQKKTIMHSREIELSDNQLNVTKDSPNGFVFENFDNNGKLSSLLIFENDDKTGKSKLIIEEREYSKWTEFLDLVVNSLNLFQSKVSFFIEAISLNYLDEFIWNNNQIIDIDSIFKKDNEYINSKFKESYNSNLNFTTLVKINEDNVDFFEEKLEIITNNDLKRIQINHVNATKLLQSKVLSNNEIEELKKYFEKSHAKNKEILISLLSDQTLQTIGIKN